MSMNVARRAIIAMMGAVLLLGYAVPTAYAAPPPNDEISNARVITTVPSRFNVDTSEATVNLATDTGGFPCMGANSVWYRFRPTAAVTARVVTFGSAFIASLGVFTGTPGNLTPVACNSDNGAAVEVAFSPNTTYFVALSTCCAAEDDFGGNGVLRLYLPRALTFSAPLVAAQAGNVSGRAIVTGTFRCSNPAAFSVLVTVRQRIGTRVASGVGFFPSNDCRSVQQKWTALVDSDTGVAFRPGRASVTLERSAFDGISTTARSSSQVVMLQNAPNAIAAKPGH